VRERCLKRLVMLGEGTLSKVAASEESADPFRVHDEGPHTARGVLVCLEVRDVRTRPCATVPRDEFARGIKGLTARIAGGPVVEHTAIGRPRPRPVDRLADAGGICVIPSRHEVTGRPPGAAEDPAARSRAAVAAQLGEAGELLAGLAYDLARVLGVGQIFEGLTGKLPRELLFDDFIPRTMASIDAFAAGQPVVLRSPQDAAAQAYERLAALLDPKLV